MERKLILRRAQDDSILKCDGSFDCASLNPMPSTGSPRLKSSRRFFFVFLCFWYGLLTAWLSIVLPTLQTNKDLPFGIFSFPNGEVCAQDFAFNMLYFKGIHERLISHPYRLADQEKLIRKLLPALQSGLSHAYSPIAYVLALPLLAVSGYHAYLIYTILSALGIVLLFYFYLLPRVECPLQFYALMLCAASLCLMIAFAVGQSVLITTTFLGVFWGLLRQRTASAAFPIHRDILLATLFWALCLKPSVAIIPLLLLLGAQAWRALAIGAALLLVTWISVANHYGGLWTGLEDYFYLLNHYHNADFSPFMQRRHETAAHALLTIRLFALKRALILVLGLTLLILRWKQIITLPEHFQGVVWIFLLVSPYLLPSEDWILCLLIVEGPFFNAKMSAAAWVKLLLLFGIMDLRAGLTFPETMNFQLKCLLFAWIFIEHLQKRKLQTIDDYRELRLQ